MIKEPLTNEYRVFSGPNTGKYGPEKTPYFDIFHTVQDILNRKFHFCAFKLERKQNLFESMDTCSPFVDTFPI